MGRSTHLNRSGTHGGRAVARRPDDDVAPLPRLLKNVVGDALGGTSGGADETGLAASLGLSLLGAGGCEDGGDSGKGTRKRGNDVRQRDQYRPLCVLLQLVS